MRGNELCQHLWACRQTELHLLVVFLWGNLKDWFSSNALLGWPWWAHMDDLNLGRIQPPAAFQMGVMWAILCKTGGFDLKRGANVFEEISVCSFIAKVTTFVLFCNQTSWFGIFSKLLYFLLHPFTVHCCRSNADAEAGFTSGRTSQPTTALQHEEVSKVWLSGLSGRHLVLVLRLRSGAVSRGIC